MEIVLFVAGGLLSWLLSHWYYRKSNADQELVYSKLSEDIRQIIREDQRGKLSVCELNQLLEQQTIDPDDPGPLPYKACPKCGSKNLKFESGTDPDRDETYYSIACRECPWNDWTQ